MTLFTARVKSILSGDTVVLTPVNSPTERLLHLAFLDAPRLSSNDKFGFESREALRGLLVGKTIKFEVLYTVNGREYGDIQAPIFPSLIAKLISEGSAKLRSDASHNASTSAAAAKTLEPILNSLNNLEQRAKSEGRGLWAEKLPPSPLVLTTVKDDLYGQADKFHSGIIERVVAGDRIQLRIMLSGADSQNTRTHILTPALIAGIKAPRSASADSPAEPFGEAAKQFLTDRLLQRSVKIALINVSASGLPIVDIQHPAGDIAQLLLQNGLVTVADWQSGFLGSAKMAQLRGAEKKARLDKVNIWKNLGSSSSSSSNFEAVVAKIISPDTLLVRNTQTDVETTVQLASIRGPRINDPSTSAYVPLAREFLRKKLIGKKVQVKVLAVKPATDNYDAKSLVTLITTNDMDVAALLVDQGLASVIRHRATDEDRSDIWDLLMEKEGYAIKAGRGIHSKKPLAASDTPVDASENVTRAKVYLASLQRQSAAHPLSAVVEHIASAGRLRLRVTGGKDNITLTLVLAGIRAPRSDDPHGQEAKDWVVRRYLQRDITFVVVGADKTGGFIGNAFLPGNRLPLSVGLVAEGFATVHEFSAETSGFYDELMSSQESAQNAQKNLWENFKQQEAEKAQAAAKEAEAAAKIAAAANTPAAKQYLDIQVSDIADDGSISYIKVTDLPVLTKIQGDLLSFYSAAANATVSQFTSPPRKNELVAYVDAFSVYNRAKVVSFDREVYTINLIDTGATVVANLNNLKPLVDTKCFTTVIKPLAHAAALSLIKLPPSSPTDYLSEYVDCLRGTILNKQLVGVVDGLVVAPNAAPVTVGWGQAAPAPSLESLTLFQIDSKGPEDSVNAFLIDEAYAFVKPQKALVQAWEKTPAVKKVWDDLRALQEDAKGSRVGVWEYGDADDEE